MDDAERAELIAKLFFVLTARLEDAAAEAAKGQNQTIAMASKHSLANSLIGSAGEIAIIAEAAAALTHTGGSGGLRSGRF